MWEMNGDFEALEDSEDFEEYLAWEAEQEERLDRLVGRYGLVLELDDPELGALEFLVDPYHLWKPPRVLVRSRGRRTAEVWLWEDEVSFTRPTDFLASEERRILRLVEDHFEELLSGWFNLREDWRRGRLRRNLFVD